MLEPDVGPEVGLIGVLLGAKFKVTHDTALVTFSPPLSEGAPSWPHTSARLP